MSNKTVKIGNVKVGSANKPVFVVGPCVIESEGMLDEIASFLAGFRQEYSIVLKTSYDKANRTSVDSYRGPGISKGLSITNKIKEKYGLPVLIDVHCSQDIQAVAEVADCIQIPAFLCRQTDLLLAAANTGKAVNIKKGQFMSPWSMSDQAEKIKSLSNENILLTERGSSFGYGELVVDMRSVIIMENAGYPVLYDATHSQQRPPVDSKTTGGRKEFILPLAKAARVVGASGIYCELHPDPNSAKSDKDTQLNFKEFEVLLNEVSSL